MKVASPGPASLNVLVVSVDVKQHEKRGRKPLPKCISRYVLMIHVFINFLASTESAQCMSRFGGSCVANNYDACVDRRLIKRNVVIEIIAITDRV